MMADSSARGWLSGSPSAPYLIWGVVGLIVVVLQAGLPSETFVTGDSGVKLIAARQAISQPLRPLELPLPMIGGEPLPFLEPFFTVHGDHAHAVTPELFPLVSAPLIAWFGSRGAYVLPGVGLLAALGSWLWVAILLDPRRSRGLFLLVAVFGTPWLFYGLEFWEHAPAAAVCGFALGTFIRAGRAPSNTSTYLLSGVLFGLAILLRPEAAWFALSVMVASALLRSQTPRGLLLTLVGLAGALCPLAAYNVGHFGTVVTPHLSGVAGLHDSGWLAMRRDLIWTWFGAPSVVNAWSVAPVVPLAVAAVACGATGAGAAFLGVVSILTTILVTLTAPNDGGAQWGPRYLLLAYGPAAILACDGLDALMLRRPRVGVVCLTVFLGVGGWIQRTAHSDLRGAKQTYTRMLEFVRAEVPAGGYVLTDLWWLDQIAASASDRTFLFAPDRRSSREVLDRLAAARVSSLAVIRSATESLAETVDMSHPCYSEGQIRRLEDRGLVSVRLRNVCG